LRSAGIQVEVKIVEYEYGRFNWALNLKDNKIGLREPRGEEGKSEEQLCPVMAATM
jgi:hypothetical protein